MLYNFLVKIEVIEIITFFILIEISLIVVVVKVVKDDDIDLYFTLLPAINS